MCRRITSFTNAVKYGSQISETQHRIQLLAHPREQVRVVGELGHSPLDGPQRGLDGGDVDVLYDVQHTVEINLPFLL
ncbi:hypothetical protein Mapa_004316 [Marchantia paleacea]|nr:hypothetical protein Mapa_004316 [Marchantia paleacea]